MNVVKMVDAKGLACPMPIVQAKQAMDTLEIGDVLEIHATDAGSKADLVAWANSVGHEMKEQVEEDQVYKFWIQKGK